MNVRGLLWSVAALGAGMGVFALALGGSRPAAQAEKAVPAGAPKAKGALTYTKDIAPILFKNCTSCHRPGEVAPFSLLTYQDAKKRAAQIAAVTESRFMPPWKADPAYGEYHDARYLTDAQMASLKQWAAEGASEGDPRDLPPLPKFVEGWSLGEPDAIFEPKEEYMLGAEGRDEYRCFILPTNNTEDRYVAAMEVRPGNRTVVHHVLAFLDTTGTARRLDAADPAPGYSTFGGVGFLPSGGLGGWAPGNQPRFLPEGVGTLLPKGADIVLQVHYHRSGKTEKDRTRIGLYYSKKPVDKSLRIGMVVQPFLSIPAGKANYTTNAALNIPKNVTVHQVTPHMHLLGREMAVTAKLPDGSEKRLVRIPDWDFNWQINYAFKEPLPLPQGSRVQMTARYDNSSSNPRNPNRPPRQVGWGEQTTDEMCIAFLFYTMDAEQLTKGIKVDGFGRFGGGGRRNDAQRGQLLRRILDELKKNGGTTGP